MPEFNFTTGKYVFDVSGNGSVQPIFDFTADNRCEEILGFDISTYQFSANSLTGSYTVNLQLTNAIQVLSDIIDNNNLFSAIISNTSDYSNIQYIEQAPEFASRKLAKKDFSSCRFWLLDEASDELNLNGTEISFSFAVFKSNPYYMQSIIDSKVDKYINKLQKKNE
jgi:hypothetical protein